jgi:8-oxo-dGTP pyrophosphatase MutT (NUDIX family)
MQPWKHLEETETIKIGWRTLVRKTFERPDGIPAEYYTKDALGARWAIVIALTADKQVVIAEQFRPGPEMIFQDLPGGSVDKDEDPQATALRELQEEAGYTSNDIEFLGNIRDSYSNATGYCYLAKNCFAIHDQKLEDGEFVNVKLISIDQLFENGRKGEMGDQAGLFLAYDRLQKINQDAK